MSDDEYAFAEIPELFSVEQVDAFLQKNYHCSQCHSSSLEAFHTDDKVLVGSIPDTRLAQFIPNIPYVCGDCGSIGLIWTKIFLDRIRSHG